jgi:RNA polymerase sigma-70 factor (ECF subfamily)
MSDYEQKSDLELVEACRQHDDQKAFAVLINRYERPLYNFILRMVGTAAEAEELFLETFLRIYKNLHNFRGGASFSPWAYRIAHNLCIDSLRRPDKRIFVSFEGEDQQDGPTFESRLEGTSPDPEDELYRRQLGETIQEAVNQLPVKLRSVFVLYQYQHLPYEQIASSLDIPIGTVKSRMHSALKQLSQSLRHLTPTGDNPRETKKG